jgi:hypothetical protein
VLGTWQCQCLVLGTCTCTWYIFWQLSDLNLSGNGSEWLGGNKPKQQAVRGNIGALRSSFFKRAPYKQQAVENQSIICQIKTEPSSWTTAAASFVYLASARLLAPIVALASTSFANPAFLLLAVVLVRALRGVQSPVGEKTEISLL